MRSSEATDRSAALRFLRLAAASVVGACWLAGAGAANHAVDFRFHRITVADGLVQGTVNAVFQDRTGFLWFGTADGLDRFDGYDFRRFRHRRGDPTSLADSFIRAITEDAAGRLWVGTQRGLSRYDPEARRFDSYLTRTAVRALLVGSDGAIRVGTDIGLFRFDPAAPVAEPVPVMAPVPEVHALAEDDAGVLWIGTRNRGLLRLPPTGPAEPVPGLGDAIILALFATPSSIYVGTQNRGLLALDHDGGIRDHYRHDPQDPRSIGDDRVAAIEMDDGGRLWVGSFSGLQRLRIDGLGFDRQQHDPAVAYSLAPTEVRALEAGFSGQLWVGSSPGGVSRFDPTPRFDTWGARMLGNDIAICIAVDLDGSVWVGTTDGLARVREDAIDRYVHVPSDPRSLSNSYVRSCALAGEDVWIGTQSGLNRFDRTTGDFQRFLPDPRDPESLTSAVIRRILITRTGGFWVGTHEGVRRFDPPTGRFSRALAKATVLDTIDVSAMTEGADGAIWVGSHFGQYRLMPDGRLEHFAHDPADPDSLSHSIIDAVHQAADGTYWIGTNGGLNRMIEGPDGDVRFEYLGRKDGLRSEAISEIEEDAEGRFWISTFEGLTRFDPATREVRNYDTTDDALPDYAVAASTRGPDGRLYFGGIGGVTTFHPDQVRGDPTPPRVVLTDLRLANASLRPRSQDPGSPLVSAIGTSPAVVLDYGFPDLTVEFAALHYAAPLRNRYQYRVDGLHDEWIDTDADRRAVSLVGLAPDTYLLRLRGSSRDGVWQPQETTLAITVLPPWWMTWWARTSGVVALVALAMVLYQVRFRSLTQRQTELEALVQERTEALTTAYERMEHLSMTDPLTGLANRRFMLARLEDDVGIVARRHADPAPAEAPALPEHSDLTFFLVDLDRFKKVNDAYGHAAGDRVLLQARDVLLHVFRDSDYCARWGGEEFLGVARFTDRKGAPELAERLRHRLAATAFDLGDQGTVRLTASIGFASFPFVPGDPEALDWLEVVNVADRCLYSAKRSGRDAWVGLSAREDAAVEQLYRRLIQDPPALIAAGAVAAATSVEGPLVWER
ncbi:MAG: two-component regulator propeller domain-containing protein [Pseudomonadota bacterium]